MRQTFYPFIFLLVLLAGCKNGEGNATEAGLSSISVRAEEVKTASVHSQVSVSGNVEGNTTVRLGFLVGGKINYISASEGQLIARGQLVASLDPTNYNIAKQLADVQAATASDEYNRLKIMHDRNSLSESDFSKITFSLQQARLQQQLQQKNLTDTKLYAPISGVLIKKLAEPDEIVGVGTPLFVISDISKVKVLAYIPESELRLIKLGQSATVIISALDKSFTGKVIEVGSAADETSRAFTIKIEVNNPGLYMRPGMIAEASIDAGADMEKILIPVECIRHDLDNQEYVFVADKSKGRAFKRKVSIGKLVNNKIEITGGLNAGEMVVMEGQAKLTDGATVTIK